MSSGLEVLAEGVLNNNLILLQGLGLYVLTRYTTTVQTAAKAGVAMLATMITASVGAWAVIALTPSMYGLETPFFLLIALLSSLLWHRALATTHWLPGFDGSLTASLLDSALVGVLLLMHQAGIAGPATVGYGFSAALGYGVVLLIMAGIRERLALSPIPKPLQGAPILLIAAGLFALGLMGFRF